MKKKLLVIRGYVICFLAFLDTVKCITRHIPYVYVCYVPPIILIAQGNISVLLPPCISPSSPGMNQPVAKLPAQTHPGDKSPLNWFLVFTCSCIPQHQSQSPSHHTHFKSALHQWKFASKKGANMPQWPLELI